MMNFIFPDGTDSEASTPPGSPQVERAGAVAETNAADNKKRRTSLANLFRGPGGAELSKEVLNNITMFKRKQKKVGTIVCCFHISLFFYIHLDLNSQYLAA